MVSFVCGWLAVQGCMQCYLYLVDQLYIQFLSLAGILHEMCLH
jgi:hypothetical protein